MNNRKSATEAGKFYVRSGCLSVVLTSDGGPVGAAMKFVVRSFQGGSMSQIGDDITVSESGRFTPGSIVFNQETVSFLRDKLGVDDVWIIFVLARDLYIKNGG